MSASATLPASTVAPRPFHWSWDDYMRAADAGVFDGQRVMLIDGEVLQMSPMKDAHAHAVVLTSYALASVFATGYTLRCQLPMRLLGQHDPEPDLVIVAGPPRSNPTHPTTALLVVEVADTTLRYDLGDKANLYAAAGIADYWVVDIIAEVLHVLRDPVPDSSARFGHAYQLHTIHARTASIAPLAEPASTLPVADLLP